MVQLSVDVLVMGNPSVSAGFQVEIMLHATTRCCVAIPAVIHYVVTMGLEWDCHDIFID